MLLLLLLHIDAVIFINEEEKWAWSFPSDQTERSTCRNIFTTIVFGDPSTNEGVIMPEVC